MHGGEGEGGVDGGGAGQNPHVPLHSLKKSADLHFSNFATLFKGNQIIIKIGMLLVLVLIQEMLKVLWAIKLI